MTGIFQNVPIQLPSWLRAGDTGNDKKLNALRNDQLYITKVNELMEIALKRYKIEGLPETCNERIVLNSLLWYANVVFWDCNGSILALPGTPSADITLYGDWSSSYIYGANGFNKKVKLYIPNGENVGEVRKTVGGITLPKTYDAVMVKESMTMFPFINQVFFYADAISDTLRTLDNVRLNIKQPFMVACDEKIKKSVEKMFKERNNNNAFIVGTGDMSKPAEKIQLFPFDANPQNLRDCTMLIEWYMNQFLQLCGVHAANIVDKKAQVSVDELHSNDDVSNNNTDNTLDYLNSQLEIANKAFGLSMRAVSTQPTTESVMQDDSDNDFEEGDSDGEDN